MSAADNKDLVRRLVDQVVNARDLGVLDEIYIFRIENGRLTGATAIVEDNLTRMRQLGFEL